MSAESRDSNTFSFPQSGCLCFFFLARTSTTLPNRNGGSGHPCFALHLRGKATNPLPLSLSFFVDVLYQAQEVPFYSEFAGCYMKGC